MAIGPLRSAAVVVVVSGAAVLGACRGGDRPAAPAVRPSILLITLDTTRADAIGPEAPGADTPAFNALAARGRRFRQAYATVPETLPSHTSMLTGLYPAGHGVHENARFVAAEHPLAAERLKQGGYRTAAFVSSFVLARRFGLARGFDEYDDELAAGRVERGSLETTDRAIAFLSRAGDQPMFLWVHYFDPHTPYLPPEPFRSAYRDRPYQGEVAAMDREVGRLVQAFDAHVATRRAPAVIIAASDHGEGLGDHGETQHGHLLYQSTMHVPLVVVAPGVEPGTSDTPVSSRRIYHTLLDVAGIDPALSLRAVDSREVVIGEAMKPFLEYGWQPQIMAVEAGRKAIFAGTTEVYDLAGDPRETRDLGSGANISTGMRRALDDYPVPSPEAAHPAPLSDEARRSLASLGYVSASAPPTVRKDAPRPIDMVHLLGAMEQAATLFVQERYGEAIPLLRTIQQQDPHNLDVVLRLATAHSSLGQNGRALEAFKRAAAIAPRSPDVRMYLALHYARGAEWPRAVPILEQVLAETPDRLPAIEALADLREKQGRIADAIALRQRIHTLRAPTTADLVTLGRLAMAAQQTTVAIGAFEQARALAGARFDRDLELGVLYLASRRFTDARDALDRVPSSHPEYPMALFKRAQVSVLLEEPDRAARIALARKHADATTRELIARERLFSAQR